MEPLCGVFNVYKEPGWTSFDVVAKMRGICRMRKVGHAGTLDPAAEGVLPVCAGRATRIADRLSGGVKTYRARMKLGVETDTLDMTGAIVKTTDPAVVQAVTGGQIREAAAAFAGGYDQIPPMYSAKHVQGKRLYELAREGKVVEREPVHVRIDEIRLCDIDLNAGMITIEVTCGRGTYIRSLCADIGSRLGCGAVMTHLIRTRVGAFSDTNALKIGQILEAAGDPEAPDEERRRRLEEIMVPVDQVFSDSPSAAADGRYLKMALNGNKIPADGISPLPSEDLFRLYSEDGTFIGLYRPDGDEVRPVTLFARKPDDNRSEK